MKKLTQVANTKPRVTLCITGATGIPIAFTLLQQLLKNNCIVHVVVSKAGMITVKQETGIALGSTPAKIKNILTDSLKLENSESLFVYGNEDWYAPIASGSSVNDVTIVCPCSMTTLAKIASGVSDDLLVRACDVAIKERKNLILVPREMPFSPIHLENMHKLAVIGVSIMAPTPAFYTHPQTIQDIVDFFVSRILDQAGIKNDIIKRW